MRRATHYGVTADKQEVEHLRSEVTRLRNHIGDMGDKIGQLTSLVEALAVEGKPPVPAIGSEDASPSRGVELGEWRGLGQGDSGVGFCVGGLGGGSFREYGLEEEEEEDSRFFPPAVMVGGGGAAGVVYAATGPSAADAAFLPSRFLSRKRKLVGLDGERITAEQKEEGQDEKAAAATAVAVAAAAASAWPPGVVAAGGGVIKQEVGIVVKQETGMLVKREMGALVKREMGTLVKQEVVEESYAGAAPPPWPPSDEQWPSVDCCPPLDVAATAPSVGSAEATAVAAAVVAAAPVMNPAPAPSPPQPLVVEGSSVPGGEFLQGFTDQFLSFESPTSSYMLTDRSGGCCNGGGTTPAGEALVEAASGEGVLGATGAEDGDERRSGDVWELRRDNNGSKTSPVVAGGDSGGGGGGGGGRANGSAPAISSFSNRIEQYTCRGQGDYSSDGRIVGCPEEDDSHIDICGNGMPLTSGQQMAGLAEAVMVPAVVVAPLARSEVAVGVARDGAVSPFPPHMEELQDNLESLPPHSRTKVLPLYACNVCVLR